MGNGAVENDHRPVACGASAADRAGPVAGYGAGNGNGWMSGFTSYDAAWIDSLTRLVQELRGTGANVLVLGPTPDPHVGADLPVRQPR